MKLDDLLKFEKDYKLPQKRGSKKYSSKENLESLNNEGHKILTEDFSDYEQPTHK